MNLWHFLVGSDYYIMHVAVKLVGKLQDGTVFLRKGHGEGEELFEFKADDGNPHVAYCIF